MPENPKKEARKHLSFYKNTTVSEREICQIILTKARTSAFFFLMISVLFSLACESPSLKSNRAASPLPENKQSAFQQDLQSMETADFKYIFVFRRKDGGNLIGEDKTYLKTYLPPNTNRVITSDDDKAAIAGSHYKFPPESLENLRKRFDVEDHSKPSETVTEEKTNTNN